MKKTILFLTIAIIIIILFLIRNSTLFYQCPTTPNNYINCSLHEGSNNNKYCTVKYQTWAQKNCSHIKFID